MNINTALLYLKTQNYFIWDEFLTSDEVTDALAECVELQRLNQLKSAGIGKIRLQSKQHRTDQTIWFDESALTKAQTPIWNKLQTLKEQINAEHWLGLWSFECHYSHYGDQGFYQKHLDRFNDDDKRVISMVLYLNESWVEFDAGELRLFPGEPQSVDIAPIAGRLVCFLSSDVLHEVRKTNRDRYSIAGWWKRI